MTTSERTAVASPLDKFEVLAADIDDLRVKIQSLHGTQSIDDQIEIVNLKTLSRQHGLSLPTVRRRIEEAGGRVFKIGGQVVIRKVKLLEVFEQLELPQ